MNLEDSLDDPRVELEIWRNWYIARDDERWAPVPEHLRRDIYDYVVFGVLPGSFLKAVIADDLEGARAHADDVSAGALPALFEFFRECVPMNAWGSRDALEHWVL